MSRRGRIWAWGLGSGAALLVLACALVFVLHPLWVADQQIRFHLWRQGVHSRYVTVGECPVHFYEARAREFPGVPKGGMPLVLVHGLESRGEDWSGLIPTLASQGFHVYAPDLMGYGRSCKPDTSYSIREQEKLVEGFFDAEGIGNADVAGWSMGGWVAAELAIRAPDKVARLVLLDSAGIYFPATFTAALFTPEDGAGLARLGAALSPEPRVLPEFVARAAVRKLQRDAWVIDRSVTSMTRGHDLLDFRLHEIRQPTLIVWGREDRLIPLSVGREMHRLIPGSDLLVVDGCGHLAPQECARPVLRGMLQFLGSREPPEDAVREVRGR